MYLVTVILLMLALPVASVAIAANMAHAPLSLYLIGRWFVFWCVGVRLLLAGARQVVQPDFTARVILHLQHDESHLVIRELGFANLAMGLIGLGSILWRSWISAAALGGTVFYLLAGVNHLGRKGRRAPEHVAMLSDLFAAVVLGVAFAASYGLAP